jgi:predicted transcriptional regulator
MNTIPMDPQLQDELEKFAREHGQSPADALQDAVITHLEAQSKVFEEDVTAIQQGYDDVRAGRTVSVDEFETRMRRKYDIPR